VQKALLTDAYPLAGRTRIFAAHYLANPIGSALGPLVAGITAAAVGGTAGWRWAFVVIAIPAVVLAVLASRLKEPPRGHNEQLAVLGEITNVDDSELPISVGAAFAALKKIRTYYWFMAGLGALGFAIVSGPIYVNLVLEDDFGLGPVGRGVVDTVTGLGSIVGLLIGGRYGEQFMRRAPERASKLAGVALASLAVTYPTAVYMPNVAAYVIVGTIGAAAVSTAIVPALSIVASVTPYRLRSMGFALTGVYLALIGGVGGAIVVGGLSDAHGERLAILISFPPAALLGGALIWYGSQFVRGDLANVALELREERDERARVASGEPIPILQARHVDFSYGRVQVLFDAGFDLWPGEVLALLGTNGAGKSTLLRVISGLGVPDRGVIRLNGRAITYASATERVRLGLVQMSGGRATFREMSVEDNLQAGAYTLALDQALARERIERAYDLFPVLRERASQPAGALSGGEQQMLAMAKALLLDPEVLLIDELSLGLAPIVTEQLLGVVEGLKAEGLSVVIVEQSLNVALAVADRAIFMEKGRIKFEGRPSDLLDRDDLVRAIFLGGA
jgi:ABC-type branched-subunit amino acid transport system ATPase component